MSKLFNITTASIYRRTKDDKNVKSWEFVSYAKWKLSPAWNDTTVDWQMGIIAYRYYTETQILVADKLIIEEVEYIVKDIAHSKGINSEYYLCYLATGDGS